MKIALVIGIGIAITIIGILIIVDNKNTVTTDNIVTDFEKFKPITFSALNSTMSDTKIIHEKVCPRPDTLTTYKPEKVNLVYLEPKYPVFRIVCERGPLGYWHQYYTLTEDNEIVSLDKNVFQIQNPLQAIEYLVLINHIGSGDGGNGHLIVSTEEYNHTCNPALHHSKIPLSVIKVDDQYLVNMTHTVYTDYVPFYPCEFQTFKVSENGTALVLDDHNWQPIYMRG